MGLIKALAGATCGINAAQLLRTGQQHAWYKCDKCSRQPADPARVPRFCPECGNPFGDENII